MADQLSGPVPAEDVERLLSAVRRVAREWRSLSKRHDEDAAANVRTQAAVQSMAGVYRWCADDVDIALEVWLSMLPVTAGA